MSTANLANLSRYLYLLLLAWFFPSPPFLFLLLLHRRLTLALILLCPISSPWNVITCSLHQLLYLSNQNPPFASFHLNTAAIYPTEDCMWHPTRVNQYIKGGGGVLLSMRRTLLEAIHQTNSPIRSPLTQLRAYHHLPFHNQMAYHCPSNNLLTSYATPSGMHCYWSSHHYFIFDRHLALLTALVIGTVPLSPPKH